MSRRFTGLELQPSRRAFLATSLAILGCARDRGSLLVFASASVEEPLREIESGISARQPPPRQKVELSFAASNVLAQQIEKTRAADVFLSADEQWMQWLADRGLIEAGTRHALLGNGLVIAARIDSTARIESAADLASADYDKFVLPDPESVPLGRYARAFLEGQKYQGRSLWQSVAPRLAAQLDARATVAALLADPRRVGIVYSSELKQKKLQALELKALYWVPLVEAPRIVYPVAVIAGRPRVAAARAWVDELRSSEARATFESFGFRVL